MVAAAVVAAGAAASVAGSAMSASAAGSAASAQEQSAANATAAQLGMFNTTQGNLQPFVNFGQGALGLLPGALGQLGQTTPGFTTTAPTGAPSGAYAYYTNPSTGAGAMENSPGAWTDYNGNPATAGNQIFANGQLPTAGNPAFAPITPNLATIAQTPGYQFNLYQGLKSTQNAASARGLGVSGAALKGAAGYATGLADSTYQSQFNNLITNQNNLFDRQNKVFGNILNMGQLGANAAAGLATNATQTGSNIGSNMIGAGNASAAGTIGQANAISGGLTGATGNAQNLLLFNALLKNSGGQGLFSAGSGGNSNTG
jgi:hypothetical protein